MSLIDGAGITTPEIGIIDKEEEESARPSNFFTAARYIREQT